MRSLKELWVGRPPWKADSLGQSAIWSVCRPRIRQEWACSNLAEWSHSIPVCFWCSEPSNFVKLQDRWWLSWHQCRPGQDCGKLPSFGTDHHWQQGIKFLVLGLRHDELLFDYWHEDSRAYQQGFRIQMNFIPIPNLNLILMSSEEAYFLTIQSSYFFSSFFLENSQQLSWLLLISQ